jgi:phospholipid/cholesterol/gamma-HCH transport system substrate-binding protein
MSVRSTSQSRRVVGPLVKLIVFAAVTMLLTGVLAGTLGAVSGSGTPYRARFTDVTGVLPGDDVRIAGVKVGEVTVVRLVGGHTAELGFTVDPAVPLPAGVHATIRYRNLVGQRYVALTDEPGGAGRLPRDGLIPLSHTTAALDLTVLFNGFRPLFTALTPRDVNSLAYEIVQVLQGEAGTVAGLLSHTASLASTLADRDRVISQVIGNLNTVLATLDAHRGDLSLTVAQLQQFVSGLAADRAAIGAAVANISQLTGATAGLLRDARPDLAADIAQLNTVAGTLRDNSAVIDGTLSRLPGRYQALTGTASDGSWFNFYLCGFDGTVTLPAGGRTDPPPFSSADARCTSGGSR